MHIMSSTTLRACKDRETSIYTTLFACKNEAFYKQFRPLGIGLLEASKKANSSFKCPSSKPYLNRTGSVFALPISQIFLQMFTDFGWVSAVFLLGFTDSADQSVWELQIFAENRSKPQIFHRKDQDRTDFRRNWFLPFGFSLLAPSSWNDIGRLRLLRASSLVL